MNVFLANVVQFAVAHGVVLGIAAVSLASVIGVCYKEIHWDRARYLRPHQEKPAAKPNELCDLIAASSRRSSSRLECRWRTGDDRRLICTWEAVADPSRQ